MLVTLSYLSCQAQHKVIFHFKLSTLNSVSTDLGDSEFPQLLGLLNNCILQDGFLVVPSKHPQGRAKYHPPNTELTEFLSTVVCLHTQLNSALNTGWTFWSCYR